MKQYLNHTIYKGAYCLLITMIFCNMGWGNPLATLSQVEDLRLALSTDETQEAENTLSPVASPPSAKRFRESGKWPLKSFDADVVQTQQTHKRNNTNTAFSCIMHVHTRMSSGLYQLPELTQVAKTQAVDVIFLSDALLEPIEFGLLLLRHIFWASHQEKPSVLSIGSRRCLAEIQRENKRQSDVLYVPGVEIVPRFFWTGSLLSKDLVCHNHQRNLIILGTGDAGSLVNLPAAIGYIPGRDTGWIIITRLLLLLFIGGLIAMVFMSPKLARRSGLDTRAIRRAFLFGIILPVFVLMIVVNLVAALVPAFDIYSPDNPERFEQGVLNALKRKKLMSFWAHPEATDHHAFKYFGVPFEVDTRPYPEVLLKTRDYTGFAGVNEGENKFIDPGSVWDTTLNQYVSGERDEPVWCFGEMLYHYEGQAGKKLSNVETMIWASEKTETALLESVRKGLFYARYNHRGKSLTLDQWQVAGLESGQTGRISKDYVDVTLRVSASVSIAKTDILNILIIRNGKVIKEVNLPVPFDLNFRDDLPQDQQALFYRAIVAGKYPLRLVTNPIFIRR